MRVVLACGQNNDVMPRCKDADGHGSGELCSDIAVTVFERTVCRYARLRSGHAFNLYFSLCYSIIGDYFGGLLLP